MYIDTNVELELIGFNQAKYVGRGTCLEWFSPLGKSSASLCMDFNGDLSRGMASQVTQVLHRIKKLDTYAFKKTKKKAKCRGRAQSWWRPS